MHGGAGLVALFMFAPACGSSESTDGAGGSAGTAQAGGAGMHQAGQGGSTAVDCANVGCAPPPLCSEGCLDACGCCPCADGEIIERTGTSYRCEGGCYAPFTAAGPDWVRLQVDEGWGPCPPDEICAIQWLARPDGSVQVMRDGESSTSTMPAADLEALEAIIADPSFLSGMQSGFECELPPTDVAYNVTLELEDAEYVEDVTGCVLSGPAGNPAERAVELLSKY